MIFRRIKNGGFSLTEVLIAAGILTMGFAMVATTFPLGAKLTADATEEIIGAIAADEGFAKVRLYGVDLASVGGVVIEFEDVYDNKGGTFIIPLEEFYYPSTNAAMDEKHYYWSALCRRTTGTQVQVTVFVSRLPGPGIIYPRWDDSVQLWRTGAQPVAVPIMVAAVSGVPGDPPTDVIEVVGSANGALDWSLASMIAEGATLVDSESGLRMVVMLREKVGAGDTNYRRLVLRDESFDRSATLQRVVWVIPTSNSGGRYPCVGVYQNVFAF